MMLIRLARISISWERTQSVFMERQRRVRCSPPASDPLRSKVKDKGIRPGIGFPEFP